MAAPAFSRPGLTESKVCDGRWERKRREGRKGKNEEVYAFSKPI
jgi:hypothetical protein